MIDLKRDVNVDNLHILYFKCNLLGCCAYYFLKKFVDFYSNNFFVIYCSLDIKKEENL